MEADWYRALFPTRLSARKAVNDFTTTAGGTRMATSVGGVLTGRGADVIVIDDPLKPDQALSDVGRKAVNEWYENTLLSRLNNKRTGCIIIVMQRLHQDDLVGHVLPQDDWTVLSFPSIAEELECIPFSTPYGMRRFFRQPGEALHPERESVAEYEATRRRIGLYNFSSQYQHRPIPISGNLVKREWLRFYDDTSLANLRASSRAGTRPPKPPNSTTTPFAQPGASTGKHLPNRRLPPASQLPRTQARHPLSSQHLRRQSNRDRG
jgi:hypothetical protein